MWERTEQEAAEKVQWRSRNSKGEQWRGKGARDEDVRSKRSKDGEGGEQGGSIGKTVRRNSKG